MRRKYKTIQAKDKTKTEDKKIEPINTNNNTEEIKNNFNKVSKNYISASNKKNITTHNFRDIIKYKRFNFNKKEETNKNDNKSEMNKSFSKINAENKKETTKVINNINNNDNKKYKFEKKKKNVPELKNINFYRFNKIRNSLINTNVEKALNTDSNINEKPYVKSIGKDKEREKEDLMDSLGKRYYRRGFEKESKQGKIKNNQMNEINQKKEEKDEKEEKEEGKKIKIQTNDDSKQITNFQYDSYRTLDKTKFEKKFNNSRNNKEANNISSLIKKFKNKPIYNSSLMSNINKVKKIFHENKNKIVNDDLKSKDNKTKYADKKDNFIEINTTTNSRNRMKRTFNFLIHQAHENTDLSTTFNKMYENYNTKKKNIDKYLTIDQIDNSEYGLSLNDNNSSLNSISNLIKEFGYEKKKKFLKINLPINEGKIEKKTLKKNNLRNLLDTTPVKKTYKIDTNVNKDNKDSDLQKGQSFNITNKIVNNNTFNTTYNIYKINNTISKRDFHSKIKEKTIILPDVNQQSILDSTTNRKLYKILINNKTETKKEEKNRKFHGNNHQRVGSYINNPNMNYQEIIINQEIINTSSINIEIIYLLESKVKSILYKINNYDICFNECQDWIFYYFNNNIYDLIINLFKNQRNKNNMKNKIKIEILCYFLCYDASFSKTFSQAGILLKTIFQLLYNNFLLIITYIINNFTTINDNNDFFVNTLISDLNQIVNKELRLNLSMQEVHNENCITEIIEQNFKQISNYYKMIIDNLYNYSNGSSSSNNSNNNEDDMNNNRIYKFPQCLSLDLDKLNDNHKLKIISMFFFDAYKLLDNYNILDLNIFYDLYLKKNFNKVDIFNKNKNNQKLINLNKNKYINEYYKNLRNNCKLNNNSKFILSQIKPYYKCSLMINLDILVYDNQFSNLRNNNANNNNKIILRPGLFQFLQEMKQIYELILFSDNSFEYLINVIDTFEKKEKLFEYVLSNEQISFDKNGSIKNVESIGRSLKYIIILDKDQTFLKLNNDNIIYVKPFYGAVNNDGNILNNLTDILKQIRYDMEDIDDVRLPLSNHKMEIFTKISTNLF